MDSKLFLKWFQRIFVPHARPTAENSVLLLLDGHASHCSPALIESARESNVILLALAPHTTHICQPLDVAVYKSFKSHLGKLVKLGQALRGDLWIPKKSVARTIKKPFESSMVMSNIKAGFKKCGVYPFNPNAIDTSQLLRNKIIPVENIDLSLPPSEVVERNEGLPIAQEPPTTGMPPANIQLEMDGNIAIIPDNESNERQESPEMERSIVETSFPSTSSSESPVPVNIRVYTGSSSSQPTADQPISADNLTISTVTNEHGVEEIEIDIYAEDSPVPQTQSPAMKNPLVRCGIVSEDLAEIFFPPEEAVPVGRKRPLRTKSKARVMTSDEVYEDIQEQERSIRQKEQNKRKRNVSSGKANKGKKTQKKTNSTEQPSTSRNQLSSDEETEGNTCFGCDLPWQSERRILQTKWVGCERNGCPHWVCPRCLPTGFQYSSEYYCADCI